LDFQHGNLRDGIDDESALLRFPFNEGDRKQPGVVHESGPHVLFEPFDRVFTRQVLDQRENLGGQSRLA
jgi:hypothetical protein